MLKRDLTNVKYHLKLKLEFMQVKIMLDILANFQLKHTR